MSRKNFQKEANIYRFNFAKDLLILLYKKNPIIIKSLYKNHYFFQKNSKICEINCESMNPFHIPVYLSLNYNCLYIIHLLKSSPNSINLYFLNLKHFLSIKQISPI
jgi:hypothetical protein